MAGKKKAEKPVVIVYTADWCPWCHRAMDFLKEKKVEFEARNVDDPKYAKESLEKSGQSGIPVILVGKSVVVGFDEARLRTLLGI